MIDIRLYNRVYQQLTKTAGMSRVSRAPGPASTVIADSLVIAVKAVSKGQRGWRVTIHRHGIVDEAGIDAYLILLDDRPQNSHYIYLIFPAPLSRSCLWITQRNLVRAYRENVDNWDLLGELAIAKNSAVILA